MNPDDSKFFKLTLSNGNAVPASLTLNPNAPAVELKVTFAPSVPGISSCKAGNPINATCLDASQVAPSSFQTALSFNGTDKTVVFSANIDRGVKLIDPANPAGANGGAQFCRSGDQFTVSYFLYDSDHSDIKSVKYEFLNDSGDTVKAIEDVDLAGPLSKAGLVNGMSFKVSQTFSGANDNDNVTKIRITVTGGNSSAQADATANCGAQTQSLLERQFTTLRLPARRLHAMEP
jgi:hypothetical protein